MRTCPAYIQKALRGYHPALSLRWDKSSHCWMVYFGDRAAFVYEHIDGKPAVDPCLSELMQIVREADSHNDQFRRQRREWRRKRLDRNSRREANSYADCVTESRAVVANAYRGAAKPFMQPLKFAI